MGTESEIDAERSDVVRPRFSHVLGREGSHFTTAPLTRFQKLLRNPAYAIPLGTLSLILVIFGVWAAVVISGVAVAGAALQSAAPLASQAKDQVISGDMAGAKSTLSQFNADVQAADFATSSFMWKGAESMPGIGENLRAVRLISHSAASLSTDVIAPILNGGFDSIKNPEGGINAKAIADLAPLVEKALIQTDTMAADLNALDDAHLFGPIKSAVVKFQEQLSQLAAIREPTLKALKVIPAMLGANGPRNYLLLFANDAEARSGIGNPGSMALITVNNGSIKITDQAGSQQFAEGAGFAIDPETETLYGEKVGNQVQDITYTPFFDETAQLARQFWRMRSTAKIDGVVLLDPVALSYLLDATGPVPVSDGITLSSENAVQELLNSIYFRYENDDINKQAADQKAFFSNATSEIFAAVTHTSNISGLSKALSKATTEGRLMFYSDNKDEMALIADTRIVGPLPVDNAKKTVIGVFFEYNLAAKMDYYFDSTVTGSTTQCTVTGNQLATFTAATTVKNILTEDIWKKLPWYISGTNLWQKGGIYRDVVVYGPVGTKVKTVKVDGLVKNVPGRWGDDYRKGTHRDRPVVQVPIFVDMQKSATVTVTFEATAKQPASSFGEFEINAQPTVRTTPVTVERPGCK